MKTENETPQPQAQQVQTQVQTPVQHTPTPAPTPIPYAAQWGTAHIPIDPSLQQQTHATTAPYSHYQSYTSHYAQAAYAHYHQYTPHPVTQTQPQQPIMARQNTTTPAIASAPANNTQSSSNNAIDTADIATLNDALGSAGVDLRAEEETLQKSYEQHQTYRPYEDRSRKQPLNPSIDSRFLGATMRTIGTQHKVTKVPEESVNYLALALRARLQDLITSMIAASHHRTDTQFDRPASLYDDNTPMWSILVRGDVAKQLAALEKAEREEEMKVRRERKERADMAAAHAANLAAQAAGG
ncbi:hypothetical protein SERLA73DRAFT_187265 [Serpula lacrymans var. lacrymans S7.3]|uniref:Transcription initiation factor TFIID subunit 4 n=1 Tax=Serpula lacrymans var. lacrymans (strain S7.3) TaxID=936435 RepID=F8Q8T5_SERL3|nr:hypothetical protein SERLA73DRAFT_187265 [Serpula lacrymans var. lacrymans S7.3]